MPIINQLNDQLQQVSALKVITGAFSEISALKINSIKNAFEQNSLYFEEISLIYHLLNRIANTADVKAAQQLMNTHERSKILHVAITSNHGFYGSLNSDTVNHIERDGLQSNNDRMIIGQVGIAYARTMNKLSPFESIVFSKDEPTSDEIQEFLDKTEQYERIFVYYPKFITMFNQEIVRVDITHSPEPEVPQAENVKYIFEPELPKMLAFFEKQVRYILFARVLLETSLSRTATRLISMDAAERRAQTVVKQLRLDISRVRQSIINSQLIASSGQLKKWRSGQ